MNTSWQAVSVMNKSIMTDEILLLKAFLLSSYIPANVVTVSFHRHSISVCEVNNDMIYELIVQGKLQSSWRK